MILAGKTTFRVVTHWSGFSQIEGLFDSMHDAKNCILSIEEKENSEFCSDYSGAVLQEVTAQEEIISSTRFDY